MQLQEVPIVHRFDLGASGHQRQPRAKLLTVARAALRRDLGDLFKDPIKVWFHFDAWGHSPGEGPLMALRAEASDARSLDEAR